MDLLKNRIVAHDLKSVQLFGELLAHWLALDTKFYVPSTWQVRKKRELPYVDLSGNISKMAVSLW
jgi:hypothetical protein